jgi:hypothetical protein
MKIENVIEPCEGYIIACWVFHDGWGWEDYMAVSAARAEALNNLGYPANYLLIDLTQMAKQNVPPDALTRFPALSQDALPNQAMTLIVGARGFAYRIADIFAQVFGKVKFATTREEAYDLIEAHASPQSGTGIAK